MLMADGLEVLGLRHVKVFAAEPVPEALAPDGAPELAGLFAVEREKLLHGADSFFVEALLGFRADAGEVAEGELAQGFREKVEREGDKAVGFFHVAGDLGEVAIGSEADGAAQGGSNALANALFDAAAEVDGGEEGALAAHEATGHFVDGEDGGDGEAALDGFDDAVVVVNVDFVTGLDEDEVRAHAFGFCNDGAGADAEGFGFVASGDGDGGVGHHGDDGDGTAAELGADFLLDGSEVGVEVDEEPVEFRGQGFGSGVWGFGCGVWGLGSGVWGLGSGVWAVGYGCGGWGKDGELEVWEIGIRQLGWIER